MTASNRRNWTNRTYCLLEMNQIEVTASKAKTDPHQEFSWKQATHITSKLMAWWANKPQDTWAFDTQSMWLLHVVTSRNIMRCCCTLTKDYKKFLFFCSDAIGEPLLVRPKYLLVNNSKKNNCFLLHVHTNTFSFEKAYFSLCFGHLSTPRWLF